MGANTSAIPIHQLSLYINYPIRSIINKQALMPTNIFRSANHCLPHESGNM